MKSICDRTEELISYLYGEMDRLSANSFEDHIKGCACCSEEIGSLQSAREAISYSISDARNSFVPQPLTFDRRIEKRPGSDWRLALAAAKDYFALAPVWLRAATVAPVLCLIALSMLLLLRTDRQLDTAQNEAKTSSVQSEERRFTESEVETLIAERERIVRESLSPLAIEPQQQTADNTEMSIDNARTEERRIKLPRLVTKRRGADYAIVSADDEEVPRLSDLLTAEF
jgi:hypothetical protein